MGMAERDWYVGVGGGAGKVVLCETRVWREAEGAASKPISFAQPLMSFVTCDFLSGV